MKRSIYRPGLGKIDHSGDTGKQGEDEKDEGGEGRKEKNSFRGKS